MSSKTSPSKAPGKRKKIDGTPGHDDPSRFGDLSRPWRSATPPSTMKAGTTKPRRNHECTQKSWSFPCAKSSPA
jgi:hypothetical protein